MPGSMVAAVARAALAASLLIACAVAPAADQPVAELAWSADADGANPPAGWQRLGAADAGALRWQRGDLLIDGDAAKDLAATRTLALDGSDATPLRVQCRVEHLSGLPLVGRPCGLGLQWGDGRALWVVLGDVEPDQASGEPRATAYVVAADGTKRSVGDPLYATGGAWLRLTVTSRDVSAFASRDGFHWQQVATAPRGAGAFVGAPAKVVVGRGVVGVTATAKPAAAPAPAPAPAPPAATPGWRVRGLAVRADQPPTQFRMPSGYQKALTWEDAIAPLAAKQVVAQWQVVGPFTSGEPGHDAKMPVSDAKVKGAGGAEVAWKPLALDERSRSHVINLHRAIDVHERQLCFASAEVSADGERDERFFFDSDVGIELWVDDALIANHAEWRWPQPLDEDRLTAVARLKPGVNRLVCVVVAGPWNAANFVVRHDDADPLARIALLKQLLGDFPEDPDHAVPALEEIARLWEAQGFLTSAAQAWAQVLDRASVAADELDRAGLERARLHRLLRDDAAVAADVQALAERRGRDGSLAARLGVARLWEQNGFPDKARAIVDAAWAEKDLAPDAMIEVALERARVAREQGAGDDATLRELVARLPANHPDRFAFLRLAAAAQLARGDAAAVAKLIDAAAKTATPAQVARLHELLAGRAETAKDEPTRLAELKRAAALRGAATTAWEDLALEADLAGAGADAKAADAAWLAGAKRAGAAAAAPAAARAAVARAGIAALPAGPQLLARVDAARGTGGGLATGAIRDWHAVGPFPNDRWQAYDHPPVDPANVDVTKPLGGIAWIQPKADAYARGFLDLLPLFKAPNSVAVVTTTLTAKAPTHVELRFGADDGLTVWLNGATLYQDRVQRGCTPGSIVVPANLKAGANVLVAMIQQGSGDWGVECSVHLGGEQAIAAGLDDLAGADTRVRGGNALLEAARALLTAGRGAEAAAVCAAVTRSCPDLPDHQLVAGEIACGAGGGGLGLALDDWLEAFADRRAVGVAAAPRIAALREELVRTMTGGGALADAAEVLRRLTRLAPDAATRARYLSRGGDILRIGGRASEAAAAYRAAFETGIHDDNLARETYNALQIVRGWQREDVGRDVSLDAATLLQTADRQAAGGDLEHALKSWQRAIDEHGAALIDGGGERMLGVAAVAAQRIREVGADAIAGYRKAFDGRARSLRARAGDDDAGALGRVIGEYPWTTAAAEARSRLADRALTGGAPDRAAALVADAVIAPPAGTSSALLVAKAAYAGIAAGDATLAGRAIELLAGPLAKESFATAGNATTGAEYATRARAALDKRKPSADWPGDGGDPRRAGRAPSSPEAVALRLAVRLPIAPADLDAAARVATASFQPQPLHPIVVGGTACIASGDELFAIDLASGAARWRARAPGEPRRMAWAQSLPDHAAAIADGAVVARVLRPETRLALWALESRDLGDGRLRWSSDAAVGDATVASSPAAEGDAVVCQLVDRADPHRRWLACFDARDGDLRWRTALPTAASEISLTNAGAVPIGPNQAAPSLAGDDAYVCTDSGSVACCSVSTGALRWVARYAPAYLDPDASRAVLRLLEARAASRVLVGPDSVFVAPRDAAAVLCLARDGGTPVWQRPLDGASALVGLAPAGDGVDLVAQRDGVERIGGADGVTRWRWPLPAGAPLVGVGAIGGDVVYVASGSALHRLACGDGRELGAKTWRELGVAEAAGDLVPLPDGVVGMAGATLIEIGAAGATVRGALPDVATAPPIARTGVAAAAPPAPLALAWSVASGRGRSVQPVGDGGDDVLLISDDRLARVDARAGVGRWSVGVAAGVARVVAGTSAIVLAYAHELVALDPATGARRWAWANPYERGDASFEGRYGGIGVGDTAICARRGDGDEIVVLDPATGAERVRIAAAGAQWCGIRGGEIAVIGRAGAKLYAQGVPLAGGAATWRVELAPDAHDQPLRFLDAEDGAALVIVGDRFATCVDLAAKKQRWSLDAVLSDDGSRRVFASIDHGRLNVWSRRGWGHWWTHLVGMADGKVQFAAELSGGDWPASWFTGLRLVGERTTSYITHEPWGQFTLICRDVSGKELWRAPRGATNDIQQILAVQDCGGDILEIASHHGSGWLRWALIDAATGKTRSEGHLDASFNGEDLPQAWFADRLVLGTRDGFACAAPSTTDVDALVDAAAAQPPKDPAERAGLAALIAARRADEAMVLRTAKPIAIDGALDDWPAGEPIALDRWWRRRPLGDAAPDAARARIAWDDEAVYVAVEVEDHDPGVAAPGGAGAVGDALRIAIDPLAQGVDGDRLDPLIVLEASRAGGDPRLRQLAGPPLPADAPPRLRIARGARLTYEIALPWAALRAAPNERPGDHRTLGFGVAVLDRDGGADRPAIAWGWDPDAPRPRALSRLRLVDLTPERLARLEAFIVALPSHPLAQHALDRLADAAGVAGPKARVERLRAFVVAHPGSAHANHVIDEIQRIATDHHLGDPAAAVAELKAAVAKAAPDPKPTHEQLAAQAEAMADEPMAAQLLGESVKGEKRDEIVGVYRAWLKAHRESPAAHAVVAGLRDRLGGKPEAVAACVALMQEVDLPRAQRRAFWAGARGIAAWRALGWIDAGKGEAGLVEPLPPERRTTQPPTLKIRDRDYAWRTLRAGDAIAAPAAALGPAPAPWAVAYAYTRVAATSARDAVAYIGVEGRAALWLDGRRVGGDLVGDRLQPGAYAIPVALHAGVNELLVKMARGNDHPRVALRLGDADGQPIDDVAASLAPLAQWAAATADGARVLVSFDAPLDAASVGDPAHWTIDGARVTAARAVGPIVELAVTGLAAGTRATVRAEGVKGADGAALDAGALAVVRHDGSGRVPGLLAEYFNNVELKDRALLRIEDRVDVDYGGGSPDPVIQVDGFSARWSGFLTASVSGEHLITTTSDDGVRLWIGDKQLIDNWTGHSPTDDSAKVVLEAGKPVPLRLEYFEGGGPGMIRLHWTPPGQTRQAIDAAHLSTDPGTAISGK